MLAKLREHGSTSASLVRYPDAESFVGSDASKGGMSHEAHNKLILEVAKLLTISGVAVVWTKPKGLTVALTVNHGQPIREPSGKIKAEGTAIGWAVIDSGVEVSKMQRDLLEK